MSALIGQQYFIANEVPCCLSRQSSSQPASSVCICVQESEKRKTIFIACWQMQCRLM